MSVVVGDVGQIGSPFAGLAAIVTLFLFGASASRMRAFVWVLPVHRSFHPSSRAATAQQVNDENHECDPQQQMNQTSGYVKTDSQKPENQKNRRDPQASRIVIPSEEICGHKTCTTQMDTKRPYSHPFRAPIRWDV